MKTLLIATRNFHKVAEIQSMLGGDFKILTLKDFPEAPAVVEDANTFVGNALKKADTLANWLADQHRIPHPGSQIDFVLADDSGLEVDALNGDPGVHSARFAALGKSENSPDADNNAKLLRLMEKVPAEKRSARFRCVIALTPVPHKHIENRSPVCFADEFPTQVFDGFCEGTIRFTASGVSGFGYDPLFVPEGFSQSFAELGDEVKNQISHRAKALAQLKTFFQPG